MNPDIKLEKLKPFSKYKKSNLIMGRFLGTKYEKTGEVYCFVEEPLVFKGTKEQIEARCYLPKLVLCISENVDNPHVIIQGYYSALTGENIRLAVSNITSVDKVIRVHPTSIIPRGRYSFLGSREALKYVANNLDAKAYLNDMSLKDMMKSCDEAFSVASEVFVSQTCYNMGDPDMIDGLYDYVVEGKISKELFHLLIFTATDTNYDNEHYHAIFESIENEFVTGLNYAVTQYWNKKPIVADDKLALHIAREIFRTCMSEWRDDGIIAEDDIRTIRYLYGLNISFMEYTLREDDYKYDEGFIDQLVKFNIELYGKIEEILISEYEKQKME